MPFPVWSPAMVITADRLTAMQWQTVRQTTNQIVNNSTTLVSSNLIVPVVASSLYRIHAYLNYTGSATPDIKFNWSLPAGASIQRMLAGPGTDAASGSANFTTTSWRRLTEANDSPLGASGTTSNVGVYEHLDVTVGVTAGNVILQFAQNVANATDTTLGAASWIDYIRIE